MANTTTLPKGKDGFTVEVMKEEDFDTCLDIAVQAFSTRNKVVMHLKVPRQHLKANFKKDSYESMKQGLALVARDKSNGKLAGFLFNVQQYPWPKPLPKGDPLNPLYDVGDTLYEKAFSENGIGLGAVVTGAVLRVGAGGTADGYEGRGVGTLLRSACIPFAKSKKVFRRVWVEPAHGATFHIWTNKLKYHLRSEIKFKDWKPTKPSQIQQYGPDPWKDLDNGSNRIQKIGMCEGVIDEEEGGLRRNCYDKACCYGFMLCALLCKCTCCWRKYTKSADDNVSIFEFDDVITTTAGVDKV